MGKQTKVLNNDELLALQDFVAEIKTYISGDKMVNGVFEPRFGELTLEARKSPFYVYDNDVLNGFNNKGFFANDVYFISSENLSKLIIDTYPNLNLATSKLATIMLTMIDLKLTNQNNVEYSVEKLEKEYHQGHQITLRQIPQVVSAHLADTYAKDIYLDWSDTKKYINKPFISNEFMVEKFIVAGLEDALDKLEIKHDKKKKTPGNKT